MHRPAAQSGTTAVDAPDVTATTLLPAATIERVAQAESDLASATGGISDDTPLVQAGAQLNAAAYSLEIAWLRVLADAGCLTDEQEQQAIASVTAYTASLQEALTVTELYTGPIDGLYGPATVDAVEKLQESAGLPVTGLVDRATADALEAAVLASSSDDIRLSIAQTAAVQSVLTAVGFWEGEVDGKWTPELTEALMAFQTELGVEPTGAVDPATLSALEQAIATGREARATTTTTAAVTTTTAAPTTTTVAP
jgi:peptidoglycan hydrolase-like protein with peptidoglycan-binding domain